jgi:hypothetical protein
MPFIPHTPESLIPRSDSRDPASTCRGVTATGRPCRRAVPGPSRTANSPVQFARRGLEGKYCWQHKDQAPSAIPVTNNMRYDTIQERTSIDTLADRLGLLEIQNQPEKGKAQRERTVQPTRGTRPKQQNGEKTKPTEADRSKLDYFFLDFFCCIGVPEEKPSRSKPSTTPHMREYEPRIITKPPPAYAPMTPTRRTETGMNPPSSRTQHQPQGSVQQRPKSSNDLAPRRKPVTPQNPTVRRQSAPAPSFIPRNPASQHPLISASTPPTVRSLLVAELAKPISPHDEPGYIYIFWLTDTPLPAAVSQAASSMLQVPSPRPRRPGNDRHESSMLRSYSVKHSKRGRERGNVDSDGPAKRTILLKIGRASNVQRRLNEWTRQCGYEVTLLRYYPYNPSSSPLHSPVGTPLRTPEPPSPEQTTAPMKVPHAQKVERLIHLELSPFKATGGSGGGGKCERCGALHREWFEVEASREGVREVDEVVRRWVAWGMKNGRCGEAGSGRDVS